MGTHYNKISNRNAELLNEKMAEFVAVRNAGLVFQHKAKFYGIDYVPDYICQEFEEFSGKNWLDFFSQIDPSPASGNYYFQLYSKDDLKKHFESLFDEYYEGFKDFTEKLEYVQDMENFNKFYDSELAAIAEIL